MATKEKRKEPKRDSTIMVDRGMVPEMDQLKKTFQLVLGNKRKNHYSYQDEYGDSIRKAFDGYSRKTEYFVVYEVRKTSEKKSIKNAKGVFLYESIANDLMKMWNLSDGWLDGEGLAPSHDGLNWLLKRFFSSYPHKIPAPYLCPIEQGGVCAEWVCGSKRASLRVVFKERDKARWFSSDTQSIDDSFFYELNLDDNKDLKWLINNLKKFYSASEINDE
jgi:hypothetical protein